jgi:hypothetical protein
MTTEAQNVKFRKQMAKLAASKRTPDKVQMPRANGSASGAAA